MQNHTEARREIFVANKHPVTECKLSLIGIGLEGLDWIYVVLDRDVSGFCEDCDEHSGSIKFLD